MFKNNCLVRKNTFFLRDALEKLGYENMQGWADKTRDKCRILITDGARNTYIYYYEESLGKQWLKVLIDCGDDEELFLNLVSQNI